MDRMDFAATSLPRMRELRPFSVYSCRCSNFSARRRPSRQLAMQDADENVEQPGIERRLGVSSSASVAGRSFGVVHNE
jgi:hypothetical protein